MLSFVTRLRNVAPFNAMLLHLQKPGSTYAASTYDWYERFNRRVKEDGRALLILWPFGPVATIYDVLDTYDEQNPEEEILPENIAEFFSVGEITKQQMESFEALLQRKKIILDWIDHGDARASAIQIAEQGKDDKDRRYRLKVNQNHTLAVQFTTLTRELTDLFLGHLGRNKKLKIPDRQHSNNEETEIEAESVAYLVCKCNGVTSKSESYLSNFVKSDFDAGRLDLYQIMRAAGQVEAILGLTAHTRFPSTTDTMKYSRR